MIEALESRQLLSVPKIAGDWYGSMARSIDGGAVDRGHISIRFNQQGKSVACAESDTIAPDAITYCRGTIDSVGRIKLKWSQNPSMRPVAGTGVGKLVRGRISFAITAQRPGDGAIVVSAFKIHRV